MSHGPSHKGASGTSALQRGHPGRDRPLIGEGAHLLKGDLCLGKPAAQQVEPLLQPARALARFKRALGSMGERPAMPADTRARLIDHFAPRVTDLEKLLAVDLSHWKR